MTQDLLKLDTLVDFSPRNTLERRVRSAVFDAKEQFIRVDGPIMEVLTTPHGEYPVFITFSGTPATFTVSAFKSTRPKKVSDLHVVEGHGPTLFDAVIAFREAVANESTT